MNIIDEIKKAVVVKYKASTLWTADAIPFYMDHEPNKIQYPSICFYHINSRNTMAMPVPVTKPEGFDYVDAIFQFTVFANDRQETTMEDICNRLEDVYHRQSLATGNSVTHIATISINQSTKFWDQQQKIWSIAMTFRILAGR
jgi:hypothetical protein